MNRRRILILNDIIISLTSVRPNLITLCGLGFILLNVLSVIIWIPDLVGPGPRWLYLR